MTDCLQPIQRPKTITNNLVSHHLYCHAELPIRNSEIDHAFGLLQKLQNFDNYKYWKFLFSNS
jgi:hypothetical protein